MPTLYSLQIQIARSRGQLRIIISKIISDRYFALSKETRLQQKIVLQEAKDKLRKSYLKSFKQAGSEEELKLILNELKEDNLVESKGRLLGTGMLHYRRVWITYFYLSNPSKKDFESYVK